MQCIITWEVPLFFFSFKFPFHRWIHSHYSWLDKPIECFECSCLCKWICVLMMVYKRLGHWKWWKHHNIPITYLNDTFYISLNMLLVYQIFISDPHVRNTIDLSFFSFISNVTRMLVNVCFSIVFFFISIFLFFLVKFLEWMWQFFHSFFFIISQIIYSPDTIHYYQLK